MLDLDVQQAGLWGRFAKLKCDPIYIYNWRTLFVLPMSDLDVQQLSLSDVGVFNIQIRLKHHNKDWPNS